MSYLLEAVNTRPFLNLDTNQVVIRCPVNLFASFELAQEDSLLEL
jgi:hypothetical protein